MVEETRGACGSRSCAGGVDRPGRSWQPCLVNLRLGLEIADTDAEGPGRRYAIWTQGCPLRCHGCCNPELLRSEGGYETTPAEVLERIETAQRVHAIVGVSLLGGEPTAQAEGLAQVARGAQARGLDVMLYTGFEVPELQARGDPGVTALLDASDLVVDGPYDRTRPDTKRRWIGSTNQRLHVLSGRYQASDPCFTEPDTIEIRLRKDELLVNGRPWGRGMP